MWPSQRKRTSMHIEKRMLLENIYKEWWGQQSAKEALNQQKIYTILVSWIWRVQKSLFRSVAWTVSVSCVFVYNAVDVNKIATAFLAKPPP